MSNITLTTLLAHKRSGEKITMLTCYDATFAATAADAGIEVLLVGDSLGMVLQGHDSTLPVSVEDMAYHTAAVKRGNKGALVLSDLPFMATATLEQTYANCATLMRAGAHMVKLEGGAWLTEAVTGLAERGIPSCVHLGLTPQSVNVFGGYKVQGRGDEQAEKLKAEALALEQAGAAMLLLECVPSPLAREISQAATIPVIGIGAGPDTDGQVLVLHDMLGLSLSGRTPKFVRNFMQDANSINQAIENYAQAVKQGNFPASEHEFSA
ncbi:3-methyl-2-oxobutanoate hydroxymethyltransferase [Thiopseudomonas acetoxidans]|uniref:3-methyl-2-oxobutanoate hydroxymethyltransferase n=1 Tax=Thiopseudomonas acetoxidans TaxID=3041622 RepID=A0ABT7SQ92_9GAMM|nr:3-methyl-2-oxobutanoate hydroxymethyltransferase [Thiopseudomonas sp. CY1220]MDM7858355.1 3-methyl-2-oxobutanoate hydroxymethyltransferase [Thiopseudomonas sp. CY1220]